ncbi:hypothetical protein [Paenibacillus sp. MER 99-2]|nr:hypothetical protein [Paenibacillus sp. MER 99-2]
MKELRLATISDVLPKYQTTKEKYIKEDTKKGGAPKDDDDG